MDTRKFLEELMEGKERDVKAAELAKAIGCSKTYISNFFGYRCELTFHVWVRIIRYLKPERESELISTVTEMMLLEGDSPKNIRSLMEYYSTQRKISLLEALLDSDEVKSAGVETKDFAKIYRIALQFQKRAVPNEELLFQIESFRTQSVEAQIFANILKAYVLYMLGEYKTVFRLGNSLETQIAKIKNPLIRDSYSARISEIMARGYMNLKNDVKKARFYANVVLNSTYLGKDFKVHMYHLLGTSYLFESYEESIKWFTLYRDTMEEAGRYDMADEVADKEMFFARVLWNKAGANSHDSLESAHHLARKGDVTAVEAICKEYEDDPFALCYLGIAKKNAELLLKSMAKFIETGDKFYAELPRRELTNNHPDFTVSANVISNIQIA
ncbi:MULTISPECIES: AimR family lysis-lysogeny pheromone receptor [Peribacillus]|uniref:AimR family lysis-lysogeny pheromone receptor n=1 Tax=Peribacillus TaxID=2675229 RepID=UPI001F4D673F|nr:MULTISPECIES: AimR family lysis-lysogeny pheromone receptor [unclassified Peribacillus]MCK1985186.1 AimR family lysis-lysogeny pheromone receptor [Peribacillus sp. Aquil_B1]MCK2007164.1 AimR family lysis-lysogeny pheromone receptor [Peribacillus sp. Aquil_B8]